MADRDQSHLIQKDHKESALSKTVTPISFSLIVLVIIVVVVMIFYHWSADVSSNIDGSTLGTWYVQALFAVLSIVGTAILAYFGSTSTMYALIHIVVTIGCILVYAYSFIQGWTSSFLYLIPVISLLTTVALPLYQHKYIRKMHGTALIVGIVFGAIGSIGQIYSVYNAKAAAPV